MSELSTWVREAFSEGGTLSETQPRFTPRAAQTDMALAVAQAIETRGQLVAEAGTGVGKTFAYLVPALLSGARTLVSTATKSLQDQLFLRDIPGLCQALGLSMTTALLKGRASYLCTHRLKSARHTHHGLDAWVLRDLARIERWAQATQSGDLAELDELDERSAAIPLVTSTRENCLGSECPDFTACHVVRARREALAADLVVVNHHLFFADLALRDTGVAELLPTVEVAVFDEAHQLAETGVQFLGKTLGSAQLLEFGRDLHSIGRQKARGLAPWDELAHSLEVQTRLLRLACLGDLAEVRGTFKLSWEDRFLSDSGAGSGVEAMGGVIASLESALHSLTLLSEAAPELARLAERASDMLARAQSFSRDTPAEVVRWVELTPSHCRLVESPLHVRDAFEPHLSVPGKAWIFTSATLGDSRGLGWFTEPTGLESALTLRVQSPFDYAENARMYVPQGFPKPGTDAHARAVAELAAEFANTLGGRTFVLTTTLRALKDIAQILESLLAQASRPGIQVLRQGQGPKRQILERFLANPRSILVGSQTFWEGIDVPGNALECVVIDKLPFPPPGDPLVEARVQRLQSMGRNPFSEYFLAEAAIALKQGAGRLIRSETDHGLLVICDSRMRTMAYGERLRAALPPMTSLETREQALQWLELLAASHPPL
jgi:ATP-dependent DNA helicase DinG